MSSDLFNFVILVQAGIQYLRWIADKAFGDDDLISVLLAIFTLLFYQQLSKSVGIHGAVAIIALD